MKTRITVLGLIATLFVVAFSIPPLTTAAQENGRSAGSDHDPWKPLRFLMGAWQGTGQGQSGASTVERHIDFVLEKRFLQVRNKCVYKPQEKNPNGETHEDWGMFSYDSNRRKLILRQFHVEGFVNQFVQESISSDGKTLVFVTEQIENIPTGWRARETYRVIADDQFEEVFELAAAGKEFEVYSRITFKRRP
ncbi:MAG: heme-binding beta-barrel domain-containing protein [Planctomycetota bacterium]